MRRVALDEGADALPAKTSITSTAITTAAIMIATSRAMPTAVITESSEKTMSSSMIWTRIAPKLAAAGRALAVLAALELVVDLPGRLGHQEESAEQQDQVAAGEGVLEQREERPRQAHHPGDREQQRDAHAHREQQAEAARARPAAPAAASPPGSR